MQATAETRDFDQARLLACWNSRVWASASLRAPAPGARSPRLSRPVVVTRRCEGHRLVVASPDPGKVRERGMLRPRGFRPLSAAGLGLPEPEETEGATLSRRHNQSLGGGTAADLPALRLIIPVRLVPTLGGGAGYSFPLAGPAPSGISRRRCGGSEQRSPTRRTATPTSSAPLRWPGRMAIVETFEGRVDGTLVWPPGHARFRLRPDVPRAAL